MSKMDKLKEIIRELIKKELEEASTSAATPGYQTPYAFSDPKKDKKKKKKRDTGSTGYNYVSEEITSEGKKSKVASYNVFGSMRELSFNLGKVIDIIDKDPHYRKLSSDLGNFKSVVDKKLKSYQAPLKKVSADTMLESINEGRYHQYRNDETMTPKQKIGRSMREIRDSLNNLDKLVKMNVRLKNELNVDSRSYWKNTHKALNKISERLVKLANKVGQLQ